VGGDTHPKAFLLMRVLKPSLSDFAHSFPSFLIPAQIVVGFPDLERTLWVPRDAGRQWALLHNIKVRVKGNSVCTHWRTTVLVCWHE